MTVLLPFILNILVSDIYLPTIGCIHHFTTRHLLVASASTFNLLRLALCFASCTLHLVTLAVSVLPLGLLFSWHSAFVFCR